MIKYLKGDATRPTMAGNKLIIHVSNCNNGWGRGFVLSLSKRWLEPEESFRNLFKDIPKEKWKSLLGQVQLVQVEEDIWVVNMIAQKGYGKNNTQMHQTAEPNTEIPLQYDALEECLKTVAEMAADMNAVVIGPRFGSGLSGGSWPLIEKMIERTLTNTTVYIYDPL